MSFLCVKRPQDSTSLPISAMGISSRDIGDFRLYWNPGQVIHAIGHDYELWISGRSLIDLKTTVTLSALKKAGGTFAYVFYHEGVISVGTDAMGFHPLYFTDGKGPHDIAFSTSLTHLKRRLKNPKIDESSLNLILNGGATIGAMSTIKSVFRLREGELFHVAPDGRLLMERFEFYRPQEEASSERDFVQENNFLLSRSVQLLCADMDGFERVIPVTAGHDSRRIAAAARSAEIPFKGITQQTVHGSGLDIDTHVAKEVMSMLGMSEHHQCLSMPGRDELLTQALEKDYWCAFESEQHDWSVNLMNAMPERSVIADGIIGDWIVNTHLLLESPKLAPLYNDAAGMASVLLKKMQLIPLGPRENGQSGEDERRALLEVRLNDYVDTGHMLITYMTFNRARRNIGCWFNAFLLKGHQMALPYTDIALFEQSLSMPLHLRTELMQQRCLAAVNDPLAALHSSRSYLPNSYWRTQGAAPTPSRPIAFDRKQVKITGETYRHLLRSPKERLMDEIGMRLLPERLLQSHTWRYLPLQRMALLLEWLDYDESDLPILSMETPPFVLERSLAKTTIT